MIRLIILAALMPAVALAQSVEAFVAPSATEWLQSAGLAALVVAVAVRFLRFAWAGSRTKRITALACVVFGVLLGWLGIAPPVAAGLAGQLVGGFVAAGFAYFGAGVIGAKARLEGGLASES